MNKKHRRLRTTRIDSYSKSTFYTGVCLDDQPETLVRPRRRKLQQLRVRKPSSGTETFTLSVIIKQPFISILTACSMLVAQVELNLAERRDTSNALDAMLKYFPTWGGRPERNSPRHSCSAAFVCMCASCC